MGVVVKEGGPPPIGAGRNIRVLAVVLAHRQSDQRQQAAVSPGSRIVDEKQRATKLWIAKTPFACMVAGAWQARIDINERKNELRSAQHAAGVGV
ncbi:hypothetical protein D3C79_872980 [compost metagenome]